MEQTVQKAFNLLEALVRSGQPRRLTELSRQLGLTKPNVYRLLNTLSILGYVKKDPATTLYSPISVMQICGKASRWTASLI